MKRAILALTMVLTAQVALATDRCTLAKPEWYLNVTAGTDPLEAHDLFECYSNVRDEVPADPVHRRYLAVAYAKAVFDAIEHHQSTATGHVTIDEVLDVMVDEGLTPADVGENSASLRKLLVIQVRQDLTVDNGELLKRAVAGSADARGLIGWYVVKYSLTGADIGLSTSQLKSIGLGK